MALAEVHTKAQCRYVFIRCLGYIARLCSIRGKKLQMNIESSTRHLGGVLVSFHHKLIYVSTHTLSVVSNLTYGCKHSRNKGMASLTAWLSIVANPVGDEKGEEKGVSSSPCVPTHTPSLHCETVKQIFSTRTQMGLKSGLNTYNAYLVGRSNHAILLYSDIRTGLSRR